MTKQIWTNRRQEIDTLFWPPQTQSNTQHTGHTQLWSTRGVSARWRRFYLGNKKVQWRQLGKWTEKVSITKSSWGVFGNLSLEQTLSRCSRVFQAGGVEISKMRIHWSQALLVKLVKLFVAVLMSSAVILHISFPKSHFHYLARWILSHYVMCIVYFKRGDVITVRYYSPVNEMPESKYRLIIIIIIY